MTLIASHPGPVNFRVRCANPIFRGAGETLKIQRHEQINAVSA